MKKALLKKRYGIPAALSVALSLVLVLSGTALAWYCFENCSSETTVQEPLSITNDDGLSYTMYVGETNTWSFDIVNSAHVGYTVKVAWTIDTDPDVLVSVSEFKIDDEDITGAITDNTVEFTINAATTTSCSLTITAAGDSAPGEVSVTLDLSRK